MTTTVNMIRPGVWIGAVIWQETGQVLHQTRLRPTKEAALVAAQETVAAIQRAMR